MKKNCVAQMNYVKLTTVLMPSGRVSYEVLKRILSLPKTVFVID